MHCLCQIYNAALVEIHLNMCSSETWQTISSSQTGVSKEWKTSLLGFRKLGSYNFRTCGCTVFNT